MTAEHRQDLPDASENALSLRHLSRVASLAEFHNVAEVADQLSCSQAAVTKSIKAIERVLGASLFERNGGDYRTTQAGRILSRRARLALSAYRGIERTLRDPIRLPLRPISNKRGTVFLAAFAHRNLDQAARELRVTISAVYGAVSALEKCFSRNLFERSRHGELVPTPFAHELAKALKLVRAEVRFAIEEIASLRFGPRGKVRIGVLPRAREYLVPHAINKLIADHPTINVRVLDAPGPNLLRAALCGDLDFIVGPFKPKSQESGLSMAPLVVDHFIAIARKSHPLARAVRPNLADAVAGYGWVVGVPRSMGRKIFRDILAERGLDEPQQLVESNSFSLIRGLLLEEDWIALSTVAEFYNAPEFGQLTTLDLHLSLGSQADADLPISVLWRADTMLPPAAQVALDYVHAAADEIRADLEHARSRMFARLEIVNQGASNS